MKYTEVIEGTMEMQQNKPNISKKINLILNTSINDINPREIITIQILDSNKNDIAFIKASVISITTNNNKSASLICNYMGNYDFVSELKKGILYRCRLIIKKRLSTIIFKTHTN